MESVSRLKSEGLLMCVCVLMCVDVMCVYVLMCVGRQTAAGLKKRLKKRQRSEREYGTERPSDKPHAGTQSSKPHAHAPKYV